MRVSKMSQPELRSLVGRCKSSSGGGGGVKQDSGAIKRCDQKKQSEPFGRKQGKSCKSTQMAASAWARDGLSKLKGGLVSGFNMLLAINLLMALIGLHGIEAASTMSTPTVASNDQHSEAKAALEAELNSLLQQHDGHEQDANSKLLSEAIISRLMLGNLSDLAAAASGAGSNELTNGDLDGAPSAEIEAVGQQAASGGGGELDPSALEATGQDLSGPDAVRLRKMLSYLHNFEMAQAASGLNNGQAFNQFPVLPASQAATIKRASVKMGNYLRQQQQHGQGRQVNSYGRNSFDFGLGKRPDASVSGNILRFGDSAGIPVSGQFGKRPSAHRYDFGLGKRVASPAYPRYDFGLGKRAPSRIRYDFGLGRR